MDIQQAQKIAKDELFKSYLNKDISEITSINLTKEVFNTLRNSCNIIYELNDKNEMVIPTFLGAVVIVLKSNHKQYL